MLCIVFSEMPAKGVAVVTGASYGLGASIAKQLATKVPKYEVVLVARWIFHSNSIKTLISSQVQGEVARAAV